MILDNQRFP